MKKKIKILIIISFILIICSYFGYKAFNLLVRYNFHNKNNITLNLEIKDSITLNYSQKLEENQEYLQFKNLKIRNDFKNFNYLDDTSTEDALKYVLYDENKNQLAAIMIGVETTYIEMINSDIEIYTNNGDYISNDDLKDFRTFLKEKDITNDIKLFEYIIEHKNDKSNIFTSIKEIKNNYILHYLMNIVLPNNLGITIIDGPYTGYILNLNNSTKEVSILYSNKRYVFTFLDEEYFSIEYIYELLNTIVIESTTDEFTNIDSTTEDNSSTTFTRTYNIVDIITNNSIEYTYLEIKQFHDEKTEIVEIKKELATLLSKNKNYEFTFRKNINNNIEDNIKSIFENTELISIVETNKVGLEQIQEPIK